MLNLDHTITGYTWMMLYLCLDQNCYIWIILQNFVVNEILTRHIRVKFLVKTSRNSSLIFKSSLFCIYGSHLFIYNCFCQVGAPLDIANLFEEIGREKCLFRRSAVSTDLGADPELDQFMVSLSIFGSYSVFNLDIQQILIFVFNVLFLYKGNLLRGTCEV